MSDIKLILGNCLEKMCDIFNESIDMILCDLPYGITACKWDIVIPFEPLWIQYKRIIKNKRAIVLTASQPFTSVLVMSNVKMFKYEWIWEKTKATNFLNYKINPAKIHENILIFGKEIVNYYPQMEVGKPYLDRRVPKERKMSSVISSPLLNIGKKNYGFRYPKSIIKISNPSGKGHFHPTQKPIALFKYLIKTYTNEGDYVLDNCMGSGTTGVACKELNRNFIGIEISPKYFDIAQRRINNTTQNLL